MITDQLPESVKDFIHSPIIAITPLSGGSICQTFKVHTQEKEYVYKCLDNTHDDFFAQEKLGLNTLSTNSPFKTPNVFLAEKTFILMEYIANDVSPNWKTFGLYLAQLHQQRSEEYGFPSNNYLATIVQNNQWQKNWLDFYRQQRLLPLIKHPLFSKQQNKQWEILLAKLDSYLDNTEPPALIHGDLWYTNMLFSQQGISLIDPAVYYASREIEIAYLEFVGDDHPQLLQAYQAHYPLASDFSERKHLYLLYPYLVHLHLFGEHYLPGLSNILNYYC